MATRLGTLATLLGTVVVLGGCGTDTAVNGPAEPSGSAAPSDSGSPAQSASPSPSPTSSPQPPTKRVKDCFDGDCTLLVSKPVSIPLDSDTYHYEVLEIVEVSDDRLTYFVPYGGGGGASSQLGVGGGGGFGFKDELGISLRVLSIEDGVATLVISPDPSV